MTPTPEQIRAMSAAIDSMEIHQRAHGMYLSVEEVASKPEPDGVKDCPFCGVTLVRMYQAELRGHYICSLEGWRAQP